MTNLPNKLGDPPLRVLSDLEVSEEGSRYRVLTNLLDAHREKTTIEHIAADEIERLQEALEYAYRATLSGKIDNAVRYRVERFLSMEWPGGPLRVSAKVEGGGWATSSATLARLTPSWLKKRR